jgi:hypothetical protein
LRAFAAVFAALFAPAAPDGEAVLLAPLFAFDVELAALVAFGAAVAPLAWFCAWFCPWFWLAALLEPGLAFPGCPPDAFAQVGVCCGGCGGLGGAFVVAGVDAVASSKAAKGCESLAWLVVDACCHCEDASDSGALTSDPILAVLGTGQLLDTK